MPAASALSSSVAWASRSSRHAITHSTPVCTMTKEAWNSTILKLGSVKQMVFQPHCWKKLKLR